MPKKKEREKQFTSTQEAIDYFTKKEKSRTFREEARKRLGISRQESISKYNKKIQGEKAKLELERLKRGNVGFAVSQAQIQTQQAQRRQRAMGVLGSRAEQMEIWAVNLDEVPMLHDMERQRTKACTPSNKYMEKIERSVTDSFPD